MKTQILYAIMLYVFLDTIESSRHQVINKKIYEYNIIIIIRYSLKKCCDSRPIK